MKSLCMVATIEEGREIVALLEAKGIPVYWQGGSFRRGLQMAIYVCLDAQFDDARAILQDPSVETRDPVDVAAYHAEIEQGGPRAMFDYLFTRGLVAIAMAGFLIAALYWMYTTIRPAPEHVTRPGRFEQGSVSAIQRMDA